MATPVRQQINRGSGVVGYNVQVAVDTEHHLIVTHEVTNSGSDRTKRGALQPTPVKDPTSALSHDQDP
jgi:hypothetical protein